MRSNRGWTKEALVALTMLGAACAQAPKGPAPKYAQTSSGVDSVEGTIWAGRDSEGRFHTWRFRAGGSLNHTLRSSTLLSSYVWQQQGARVTWFGGAPPTRYEGTITGNQLNGTARDDLSPTRSFSFRRQGQAQPEPEPPQPICVTASVEGTTWVGRDAHFEFQEGGVLFYTLASGGRWIRDGWRQLCAQVTWHTEHDRYEGTVTGNQLNGMGRTFTGISTQGMPWRFSLRRVQQ